VGWNLSRVDQLKPFLFNGSIASRVVEANMVVEE